MQDKHRIAHGMGLLVGAGLGWCSVPAQAAAAAAQPQSQSWIWILIGVVAVMLVFMIAYLVRGMQADREQQPENEAPAYIPYEPRAAVSSTPDEQPDAADTSTDRGDDSASSSSALPRADEGETDRPHEPEQMDVPAAPTPEDEPAPANAATEPADCPAEAQRPASTQAPPQAEPAPPDAWSIRFCPYCGQKLNETQRFCQRCGHRVRE